MLPNDRAMEEAAAREAWCLVADGEAGRALGSHLPDGLSAGDAARHLGQVDPDQLAQGRRVSAVVQCLAPITGSPGLVRLAVAVTRGTVHDGGDRAGARRDRETRMGAQGCSAAPAGEPSVSGEAVVGEGCGQEARARWLVPSWTVSAARSSRVKWA